VRTRELSYALHPDDKTTESLAMVGLRPPLYIRSVLFFMGPEHSYGRDYRERCLCAKYTTPPDHYVWATEAANGLADSTDLYLPLLEATAHIDLHSKGPKERLSRAIHGAVALVL
jgi:hypothetical protein